MSLIGPRPEWIETDKEFIKQIPLYPLRNLVKPGITGWAQVNQGHTTGSEGNYEKLQYDLYYVKHFSFILDTKIVIKTIYTILTGFGAK
jgi:lipopolysaccharide/colanic/teichoic acid biosynthesis glycosyltransferase